MKIGERHLNEPEATERMLPFKFALAGSARRTLAGTANWLALPGTGAGESGAGGVRLGASSNRKPGDLNGSIRIGTAPGDLHAVRSRDASFTATGLDLGTALIQASFANSTGDLSKSAL
jgi:hypothetical protein